MPVFRFFVLWVTVALVVLAGVPGCTGLGSAGAIEPIAPPVASSFPPQRIQQGERLAAIGDCAACHTVRGSASFAGGVPVPTPFGVIYGTNITPDVNTGIGAWSPQAFRRALRAGVSRDGHLLYPAFPYNHFTHLNDDDITALYAFLMTRDPVQAPAPHNKLMFPLQFRPLIAVWNALYLREGPQPAPAGQPAAYVRGAYLVASLAHCAACHSPRNRLGAEEGGRYLDGGEAEGWHAPALNRNTPSPVPWDAHSLAQYLRTGIASDHAMSAGPMQPVVNGLSRVDPTDVDAIALFIANTMGAPDAARQVRESESRQKANAPLASLAARRNGSAGDDATLALGRSVYEGSCAACHDPGRGLSSDAALQLPLAVALHLPDPRNLVHIIREGIQPGEGGSGRWMPPFAGNLSDEQIAALVLWLRRQGTDEAEWKDVGKVVKQTGETP